MKKRAGFTLVEIVTAIAIVLIVGAASALVLVDQIARVDSQAEAVELRLHRYDGSKDQVDNVLGIPPATYETTIIENTQEPTQTTTVAPTTTATPTTATPTTTAAPTQTTQAYVLPEPNPNFVVTTRVVSSWQSGGRTFIQYSFDIDNVTSGSNRWSSLVMVVPENTEVAGFWAGTYELEGTILTLYPDSWAERVGNRSNIEIQIQLSADGHIQITEFVVT